VLLVLFLSVGFAALNGNQRVTLRLGFATLYQIPLSAVAFGALVLGMLLMLVTSIHSDLKVRKILRPGRARAHLHRPQPEGPVRGPRLSEPQETLHEPHA
jgi:uncharacterized integral membrane protein